MEQVHSGISELGQLADVILLLLLLLGSLNIDSGKIHLQCIPGYNNGWLCSSEERKANVFVIIHGFGFSQAIMRHALSILNRYLSSG